MPISSRVDQLRRLWPQNTEFSRSVPGPEESNIIPPTISVDSEALGQYLQNAAANINAVTSNPQPMRSQDAGPSTSHGYDENSTNQEYVGPINKADLQRCERREDNCTCEGACGCANNHTESTDEDTRCRKKIILKLLKTGKSSVSQNLNLSTTTVSVLQPYSSASVSDSVNDSTCSVDSDFTATTHCDTPSAILGDEFEVITEVASILDNVSRVSITPDLRFYSSQHNTGASKTWSRQRVRKNINYDTESLYESIKTLNNFLARRDTDYGDTRHHLMTATLFGTPNHCRRRRSQGVSQAGLFNCVRGWRSTDDASAN